MCGRDILQCVVTWALDYVAVCRDMGAGLCPIDYRQYYVSIGYPRSVAPCRIDSTCPQLAPCPIDSPALVRRGK